MRRLCLAAVLATLGCGGCGGGDPLVGTWALQLNSSCVVGYTFDDAHAYEIALICSLTSGGNGFQAEIGTYSKDAARLNFSIEKATCSGKPTPYYVDYSIQSGPQLYMTFADGVEVLTPFDPSGAAAATFGCFMADGFHAGPLAAVP